MFNIHKTFRIKIKWSNQISKPKILVSKKQTVNFHLTVSTAALHTVGINQANKTTMSSSNPNTAFHLCIFYIKAINVVHLSPLGCHVFLCCCYELQPLAVLQGKLHEPSTKVTSHLWSSYFL